MDPLPRGGPARGEAEMAAGWLNRPQYIPLRLEHSSRRVDTRRLDGPVASRHIKFLEVGGFGLCQRDEALVEMVVVVLVAGSGR